MLWNWQLSPPWFPLWNADEAVAEGKKEAAFSRRSQKSTSFLFPNVSFTFPKEVGGNSLRTVPGGMRASGEVHMGAREVNNYEAMGLPPSPGSVPVVCWSYLQARSWSSCQSPIVDEAFRLLSYDPSLHAGSCGLFNSLVVSQQAVACLYLPSVWLASGTSPGGDQD